MIERDQPTIFGSDIIVALSSVEDGNMSFKFDEDGLALANRRAFLDNVGVDINDATLVQVTFENVVDFARYATVTEEQKGKGMFDLHSDLIADALVVTNSGHALFLPIADCTATVIYDPKHAVLMLSHLGRQSTEMDGGKKSIDYLTDNFGTDPRDVKAWLSPAVGKATYKLHQLDDKGLHEAIVEQLLAAGIPRENIEVSAIDTATSPDYFSHSASKRGEKVEGRFAVVAAMRAQGEPAS